MDHKLQKGLRATVEKKVSEEDTALSFGSGGVKVFATPMMVGIMEKAALMAVDSHLSEGYATVGIHLDIKHLAATPVGMVVRAEAELIEADGLRLKFRVAAYDEFELIGEGFHSRYIINLDKFQKSADKKSMK